jgi:hypothetical protein
VSKARGQITSQGSRSVIGKSTLLIIIGIGVLSSSCRRDPTIWAAEFPSPDGVWLASVRTFQNGGFGSASINTVVYLKRANVSEAPTEVLNFSCVGPAPHPYVLDSANAGGTIDLRMKWLTPSHLEVTYDGRATLYSRADKIVGVDISIKNLGVRGSFQGK